MSLCPPFPLPLSQFGFIDFVVGPLFTTWSDALTAEAIAPCLDHLASNKAYYKTRKDEAAAAAAAASGHAGSVPPSPATRSASSIPSSPAVTPAPAVKPPPAITHVAAAAIAETPWANGGGLTRQLVLHPSSGRYPDSFAYRVSSATIRSSGPFSVLPGFKRLLVSATGECTLNVNGSATIDMRPLDTVHAFDASVPTECTLVDDATPVIDVGLIHASTLNATGRLVRLGPASSPVIVTLAARPARHYLLTMLDAGATATAGGQRFHLESRDCLHLAQTLQEDLQIHLTCNGDTSATAILFEIDAPSSA